MDNLLIFEIAWLVTLAMLCATIVWQFSRVFRRIASLEAAVVQLQQEELARKNAAIERLQWRHNKRAKNGKFAPNPRKIGFSTDSTKPASQQAK